MAESITPPAGSNQTAREEISALVAELREMAKRPGPIVRYPAKKTGEEKTPGVLLSELQGNQTLTLPGGPGSEWGVDWADGENPVLSRLDRLEWLLGLSEWERRFVTALAKEPTDHLGVQLFADWLEEAGRPEEAESVRCITPEDGSLIIYHFPNTADAREKIKDGAEALRGQLEGLGRRTCFLCLPEGGAWGVDHLPTEDGDVLVITYPREGGEQARRASEEAARQLRADLESTGRKVFVAVLPSGFKIERSDPAKLRGSGLEVAGRLASPLQDLRQSAGLAPTTADHATIFNASVLIDRLRKDNDALRAELTELLREKREGR